MASSSNGTPPPAVDELAERSVLGALALRAEPRHVLGVQARGLTPAHFYWEKYAAIFRAMVSLAERRESIDHLTVHAELDRLGVRSINCGEVELCVADVPATGHLTQYVDRVIEMAQWRKRRRKAYEMEKAAAERNVKAWEEAIKVFSNPAPAAPAQPPHSTFLRLVDGNSGEVIGEERLCERCQEFDKKLQELEDQLKGAERELRGWRHRYAELKRDKEAEARNDSWWQTAARMFHHWQTLTNHPRSDFTADRFYRVLPYLTNRKYGPTMVERAIAGIAYDPYVTVRKNGTKKRHDGWELLFSETGKFEEFVNRAPRKWKPTLEPLPDNKTVSLEEVRKRKAQ